MVTKTFKAPIKLEFEKVLTSLALSFITCLVSCCHRTFTISPDVHRCIGHTC